MWHTILPLISRIAIIKNAGVIVPMNTVKIEAGNLQQLRNRLSLITSKQSLNKWVYKIETEVEVEIEIKNQRLKTEVRVKIEIKNQRLKTEVRVKIENKKNDW